MCKGKTSVKKFFLNENWRFYNLGGLATPTPPPQKKHKKSICPSPNLISENGPAILNSSVYSFHNFQCPFLHLIVILSDCVNTKGPAYYFGPI